MRALFGHTAEVERFVGDLLGEPAGFGNCQAIGFLSPTGLLEAGVVYHNWNPATEVIEISAASLNRSWCTKARVRLIFGYPFEQIGCQLVIARISEKNDRALRIWRALGATEHRIPRLYGRDEAASIMTITSECWFEGRFSAQGVHHGG